MLLFPLLNMFLRSACGFLIQTSIQMSPLRIHLPWPVQTKRAPAHLPSHFLAHYPIVSSLFPLAVPAFRLFVSWYVSLHFCHLLSPGPTTASGTFFSGNICWPADWNWPYPWTFYFVSKYFPKTSFGGYIQSLHSYRYMMPSIILMSLQLQDILVVSSFYYANFITINILIATWVCTSRIISLEKFLEVGWLY